MRSSEFELDKIELDEHKKDSFIVENSSFEIEEDFMNIEDEINKDIKKANLQVKKEIKVIKDQSTDDSFFLDEIKESLPIKKNIFNKKNKNGNGNGNGNESFLSDVSYDLCSENIIKIHEYLDNDKNVEERLLKRLEETEKRLDKILKYHKK